MNLLLSEPRMSERERYCAVRWLAAATDDNDPDLADYWKAEGLKARLARVAGPGEEVAEPPVPEPKRRKGCDLCGSTACVNSECLI